MKIRGLMMDPVTNMPIVILKDIGGDTVLPIWVGVYEANAIALEIEKVTTPRPMTHDLIKNVLTGLDAQVKKVIGDDPKALGGWKSVKRIGKGKVVPIEATIPAPVPVQQVPAVTPQVKAA